MAGRGGSVSWGGPVLLGAAASYAVLQRLGRRAGSSREERAARLPGDDLVARPQAVTDHAITIGAPAEEVWPWLSQMGWHLGGWYTPDWVDRLLFPANWSSLGRLDPALVRSLAAGDVIPDGPPGTAEYVVVRVDAPRLLLLHSTTHLPPGWQRAGARLSWTWCFALSDLPGGRTRLHLRVRGRTDPLWLTALYGGAVVPADYVMATGMLRGLRRRVEAHPAPRTSGRTPYVSPVPATA